jgi:hypothetical protein
MLASAAAKTGSCRAEGTAAANPAIVGWRELLWIRDASFPDRQQHFSHDKTIRSTLPRKSPSA